MSRRTAWLMLAGILMVAAGLWLCRDRPDPEPLAQPRQALAPAAMTTPRETRAQVSDPAAGPTAESAPPTPERHPGAAQAQADLRREIKRDWVCADLPLPEVDSDDWTVGLPPAQIERGRAERAAGRDWARRLCGTRSDALRGQALAAAMHAASRANDPWARLAQVVSQAQDKPLDDAQIEALRQALEAVLPLALADPDPATFALIDLALARAPQHWVGEVAGSPSHLVWPLLACDLGAACGPDSDFMRSLCLQDGLCGYPDVASALRDGLWPMGSAERLDRRRQALLAQLRAGGAGVFDPPPPSPRGG